MRETITITLHLEVADEEELKTAVCATLESISDQAYDGGLRMPHFTELPDAITAATMYRGTGHRESRL